MSESKLDWRTINDPSLLMECYMGDELVAWITKRPEYCDRGHVMGHVSVPNLDKADGWPNYYMSLPIAIGEMTDFLNWRLFKQPLVPVEPARSQLDGLLGPGMTALVAFKAELDVARRHPDQIAVDHMAGHVAYLENVLRGLYRMIGEQDKDPTPKSLQMIRDLQVENPEDDGDTHWNAAIDKVLEICDQ